ncbi:MULTISPECIES: ABC transporter ATP-binding protein [unclassified Paenibacillus]|uniref:ABC transporter ATP-binding protein n=1 Tax=unclassified Paenibacillus TaxID=185978 RepID=UPI001C0FC4B2|nr:MULTISPECIES: dipeptide ABC transporter ATP-binding protein [unclassified Paenibacillus]MBU5445155.1 dipeptide ABC transporter ATP-binding protein [Paenibacillus sp. MSJ-34]CAH0122192.1 Oligopeptide transport ATP-binding protein OppF [Paenibacillus sp. CECT 9249]
MSEPILQVRALKKHYPVKDGILFSKPSRFVKAVDDVSFDVFKGETLGIVGESGCGKSTMARLVTQLVKPTSGSVLFKGKDLSGLSGQELKQERKHIQMVFQNPYASLDPRKTVEQLIMEPLVIHNVGTRQERLAKVRELLEVVGLSAYQAQRYPHEFSGGQRQRINIARALALNPDLVICDEPVSALDVSIQAQVINLLKDLQSRFGLTYIFISHDLNVVKYISDRIVVMYLGKVVEMGTFEDIYNNPRHPYTRALLSAVPKENPFLEKERILLSGDVPSPMNPPAGCHFHKRCPFAVEACGQSYPELVADQKGHAVACHLADQI